MKNLMLALFVTALLGAGGFAGWKYFGEMGGEQPLVIGTGGKTGVYFVVGNAVCRLANRGVTDVAKKCTAPSTGGSVDNIKAIASGERSMGVAQSDWQYHAYNGSSKFSDTGANKELRAVFSVHAEPFTVVARADAGINTIDDLKGKRVNIGNPGSGQRGTMEVLMAAKGITNSDFKSVSELESSAQGKALCDNEVDAIVFTVGHPSGSISSITKACSVVIVSVAGPVVDELIADNAYYAKATIPGGMYAGTKNNVETFGVGATLVSSTKMSSDAVYDVVRNVFDNFKRFKGMHPAFANLKEEDMIKNGLSAPLHDGAARYYKEKGWM